jgi:hypothetical protein
VTTRAPGSPYEWFERAGGRQGLRERLTWSGFGHRVLAGIFGGTFAGACMMLFAVLYYGRSGRGFWLLPKLFAATFLGVDALVGGAGPVVLGLAIHALVSMLWGILFAFVVPRRLPIPQALGWGTAHAFLVWATMTWTVLPWADPTLYPRTTLEGNIWLVMHLVYGVASFVIVPLLAIFPLPVDPRSRGARAWEDPPQNRWTSPSGPRDGTPESATPSATAASK